MGIDDKIFDNFRIIKGVDIPDIDRDKILSYLLQRIELLEQSQSELRLKLTTKINEISDVLRELKDTRETLKNLTKQLKQK